MKIPFKIKIYAYFVCGAIIASLLAIAIVYNDYNSYINAGIDASLLRGANAAKNIIEPTAHNSLFREPGHRDNIYYHDTLNKLHSLAEASNFSYIYTLIRLADGRFYFIYDTEDFEKKDTEPLSFSNEYRDMPAEVLEAYQSKSITITRKYYTDQWGTFKSIYLPVLNPQQEIEFIIGVDYDASYISSLRTKMIIICIIAFVATLPFIALLVILLKRDVVSHVNELNENILHNQQENIALKNYLSNIIESMPSILIAVDDKGIVTQWNHAAAVATGIPASAAVGKDIMKISPVFCEYFCNTDSVISNQKPVEYHRTRLLNNDDQLMNVTLFPLTVNCVQGIVLRADDITELEQKDQQLRQIQKMETIGNLAGGIAHDFNNMLGGIMGALSILQSRKSSGTLTDELLDEYFGLMEEAGKRSTDLAKQLMLLSRSNETSFKIIDLSTTVTNVIRICRTTFDKSVTIEVDIPNTKVCVNADPTQLEQVLLNLCVNAGHAMTIMRDADERQGGTLHVSCSMIRIDDSFNKTHPEAERIDYWKIAIRDTGVGIDKKTIAKIFEPFFTTKQEGKGTGLGLSVVYNIIKNHKGFIDVYSEIKLGSEFSVYLPAHHEHSPESSVQKQSVSGSGMVLVIDDEDVIRITTRDILEECGYSVITAASGKEAIKLSEKNRNINLAIVDVVMPDINGFETCKLLKAANPETKVILTSGFNNPAMPENMDTTCIDGFIQKPYTIESLSKTVNTVINKKK